MTSGQTIFIVIGCALLISATRVVTCKRVFHAAMWLIAAFFNVAALYMVLESPFMAGVQLFIYIGGIAVLTVIAIMVTKGTPGSLRPTVPKSLLAALIAILLFAVMAWMIIQVPWPTSPMFDVPEGSLEMLGIAFVDPNGYLLMFEVVSVLLLVVLIGALYLGRERKQ